MSEYVQGTSYLENKQKETCLKALRGKSFVIRPAAGRVRTPEIQPLYAFPNSGAPYEDRADTLPLHIRDAAAARPPYITKITFPLRF